MAWHFITAVADFFKKLGQNTNWEQTASTDITLVAPGLETIVALSASEADASEVQKVITESQADLNTLSTLLAQARGGANTEAEMVVSLNSLKANLSGLLTAGHIKNPATVAKVTAIVNGVVAEIEAIINLVPKS